MLSTKKCMISLLVMVLVLSLVMTGCGSAANVDKTSQAAAAAPADNYPNRPVELVIPFSTGGGHYVHAQAIANRITPYLGKPISVVSKPGGSGSVGVTYAKDAKPDGYTMLFTGSGPNTQLQYLMDVPYKPSDFISIAKINSSANCIVVSKDSPFKTLQEFTDYMKAHPGELKYSSSGTFGATHIPIALYLRAAGAEAVHVPFNGGSPAITAILGGQVDFGAPSTTNALPFLESGDLRVLATTDSERSEFLPDVPTLKELGYDVSYSPWRGIMVHKDTPQPIVDKLRKTFDDLHKDAEFQKLIKDMDERLDYASGEEFQKIWDEEIASQGEILKILGEEARKEEAAGK